KGSEVGPTVRQPEADSGVVPRRAEDAGKAGQVDALRPAWASCTAVAAPCWWQNSVLRDQAATCGSFHRPVYRGQMHPVGDTEGAAVMTSPKPPAARAQRWTRCESVGTPASVSTMYWHMGASNMRLRIWRSRRRAGARSVGGAVAGSRTMSPHG